MVCCRIDIRLLVLPIIVTATLFLMLGSSLPLWQSFNHDPDYYYLLNGLRLVEGLAPTDVSHPGTPVQLFIAAVLRAMHPLSSSDAIVDAVLHQPEQHLVTIATALYPLVGFAVLGLGLAVERSTGKVMPALLAQSSPLLSMIIPKFALHPKPEPFLVIAACWLAAAAVRQAGGRGTPAGNAALAGVALALGTACKLQFAPLALVPVLLFDLRRNAVFAGAAGLAFLAFTAAAWPSYPIWAEWISRMALHSGAYGGGGAGVVDWGRYPRALLGLFGSKLIFTATVLGSLAAIAVFRKQGSPWVRLLGGLVLAELAMVVVVAKQPAAHYMVPALMLTGPSLAALWVLTARGSRSRMAWTALGVVLALLTVKAVHRQNAELAGWTRDAQALDMGRFAQCAKIYYDGASALSYALMRGDMNAQARYSPRLAPLFPGDEYIWFTNDHTWWKKSFTQWNQPRELDQVVGSYPCTVFRGNQPWTVGSELIRLNSRFRPQRTCEVGEETLFTIGVECDGTRF